MQMILKILILVCVSLTFGCANIPKIPVKSQYLNETVDTTVDSKAAKYYLEHYFPNKDRNNKALEESIKKLNRQFQNQLPDHSDLKQISMQFSNDFAALFYAEQLMKQPQNQRWFERFQFYLNNPSQNDQLFTLAKDYQVLVMPGWNYVDNGYLTGSDMALPRRLLTQMGIENHFLLPPSNGSVEDGATVLTQAILNNEHANKKIIVVGASAAGPAIHLTLGEKLSAQQQKNVVAWINLGGILQGSPLVDYFQKWPQKALMNMVFWYKNWDKNDVISMSNKVSRIRYKRLQTTDSLLIVNYLALALSGNLSDLSNSKYPLIMSEGPNDGLTLLPDAVAPRSATLIAVNSDHYFGEDERIEQKTTALLKTVLYFLNNP